MKVVFGTKDRKLSRPGEHMHVIGTYTETGANCPITCQFHPAGNSPYKCYTMKGHTRLHSISNAGIEHGKLLQEMTDLCIARDSGDTTALQYDTCRMHIAGDVIDPATGNPDPLYIAELITVCDMLTDNGIDVLGYTHTWRHPDSQPLKKYFLASCDTWQEVEEARGNDWYTQITDTGTLSPTPAEIKPVLCPNQITAGNVKCRDCMLCSPSKLNRNRPDSRPVTRRTIVIKYH